MNRNIVNISAFVSLMITTLSISGCATVFKGSNERFQVTPRNQGARVFVDGFYYGVAPVEMELETRKSHRIEIRKEGFETKVILVNNSVGVGWVILDVLGGLIPVIIDAATGSWYSLEPSPANGVFETSLSASTQAGSNSRF